MLQWPFRDNVFTWFCITLEKYREKSKNDGISGFGYKCRLALFCLAIFELLKRAYVNKNSIDVIGESVSLEWCQIWAKIIGYTIENGLKLEFSALIKRRCTFDEILTWNTQNITILLTVIATMPTCTVTNCESKIIRIASDVRKNVKCKINLHVIKIMCFTLYNILECGEYIQYAIIWSAERATYLGVCLQICAYSFWYSFILLAGSLRAFDLRRSESSATGNHVLPHFMCSSKVSYTNLYCSCWFVRKIQ